jgi:hypothetical protein
MAANTLLIPVTGRIKLPSLSFVKSWQMKGLLHHLHSPTKYDNQVSFAGKKFEQMKRIKSFLRRPKEGNNIEDGDALDAAERSDRKSNIQPTNLRGSLSLPNMRLNLGNILKRPSIAKTSTSNNQIDSEPELLTSPVTTVEITETILSSVEGVSPMTNNSFSSDDFVSMKESTRPIRAYKSRSHSFNERLSMRLKNLLSEELTSNRSIVSQQLMVKASDYQFNFHMILQNRETCSEFLSYLKRSGCPEGLEFLNACDELNQKIIKLNILSQRRGSINSSVTEDLLNQESQTVPLEGPAYELKDLQELYLMAKSIYSTYIEPKSFKEINISGEIRNWIYLEMNQLQSFFEYKEIPQKNNNKSLKNGVRSPNSLLSKSSNVTGNITTQDMPNIELENFRNLFKVAYSSVKVNLETDAFQRFVRSEQWNTYFCKNFMRIFSINKGMALHRSKIQILLMNRTDFLREYITDRDLQLATSLMNSSQFWTQIYENFELNQIKVFHSGNEVILDRKATETYGPMPVIKLEAVYKCSHHDLLKLLTSQEYGNLIGFLGNDITNSVSGTKPVIYSKVEYKSSHERAERIKSMASTPRGFSTPRTPRTASNTPSPISSPRSNNAKLSDISSPLSKPRSFWQIVKDQFNDRVYNTASFICEVPSAGILEKKKQLSFCSTTLYDTERKCYYRILKPSPINNEDRNPKCQFVYAFIIIIIQEISENMCKYIQFVSSNSKAATTYTSGSTKDILNSSNAISNADDNVVDIATDEKESQVVHIARTAARLKHGVTKQCYLILDALYDWERRPKLVDLCFSTQTLKDNTREEEEEKLREKKKKENEKELGGKFFQNSVSKISFTNGMPKNMVIEDFNLVTTSNNK